MSRYKPPAPRYDEVYFEGTQLLDEMAGLDVDEGCRPMTPEESEAAAAFVKSKSRLLTTISLK